MAQEEKRRVFMEIPGRPKVEVLRESERVFLVLGGEATATL